MTERGNRLLLVAAAALATTACSREAEPPSIENNAELIANALEQKADNLEALAAASSNEAAAALLDDMAANFDAAANDLTPANAGDTAAR